MEAVTVLQNWLSPHFRVTILYCPQLEDWGQWRAVTDPSGGGVMITVQLEAEKITTNTVRFREVMATDGAEDLEEKVFGTVYVQQLALARLGDPDHIVLTLDALPEEMIPDGGEGAQ